MMSCLLHCVSHLTFLKKQFLIFRIINYLDEGSIFNKGQGKKLSVRLSVGVKGFYNLSRTMKFLLNFHHRLSIGKIWYKFHGPRQIKKPFKLSKRKKRALEIRDKFVLDHEIYTGFLHRLSVGHGPRQIGLGFPVLFFYLSRTFRCLSSLSCPYRQQ